MFRTCLLVSVLSLTTAVAEAGQLSVTISPSNEREAVLLELGITLYSLHRDQSSLGDVRQAGTNNRALLLQSGRQNTGVIRQRGSGHVATLRQQGSGRAFAIIQSGRGTEAHIDQSTVSVPGILIQHGW
jgi:hypothetical protein